MHLFGLDLQQLLSHSGAVIGFIIIFAESSIVFFLPGDSFIFAAAILASQGILNIWELSILMAIGAVLGNNLGYYLGKRYGVALFSRKTVLFNEENLLKTQEFYAKHGPITIILARFTPIVRTFAPILAGVAQMKYSVFFFYNLIGALLWVAGLGMLGYYAGSRIPNIDHYILPIIAVIILASVAPALIHYARGRNKS